MDCSEISIRPQLRGSGGEDRPPRISWLAATGRPTNVARELSLFNALRRHSRAGADG
jgi:hypothetical protein